MCSVSSINNDYLQDPYFPTSQSSRTGLIVYDDIPNSNVKMVIFSEMKLYIVSGSWINQWFNYKRRMIQDQINDLKVRDDISKTRRSKEIANRWREFDWNPSVGEYVRFEADKNCMVTSLGLLISIKSIFSQYLMACYPPPPNILYTGINWHKVTSHTDTHSNFSYSYWC